MVQHFWIIIIKILMLEFDAIKTSAAISEFLPPPSDVRLLAIDTSSLRLLWSPPNITNETLIGFNITWSGNETFVANSSSTFDIRNLETPGAIYTANISAYYADQQSSAVISVSNNTYPSPASDITVVSRTTDRFDLNWTHNEVSDNCTVRVEEAPNATTACFSGNRTAVISSLPTAGKEYTINVEIYSGGLKSMISNVTERTNPSPASDITVVSRTTDRFDLNWTHNGVSDNCTVRVEEAPNATTTCFSGNRTAVISSLSTAGKEYTINVEIYSGGLKSMNSNVTARTSPPSPGSLYCTSETNASLTIGIGPPPSGSFELDGYSVSISSKIPRFNYTSNRVVSASTSEANATIIESGLTAGVTYSISAKTRIQDLFSDGQSIIECTTIPSQPYNLTVVNRSTTSLDVEFEMQGEWDSCYASVDNAPESGATCTAGNKRASISKLSVAGHEYTVSIVAGSGSFNSSASRTNGRTSPPNPGPLHCTSTTTTSLTIGIGPPPSGSFELDGYSVSISSKIPRFNYTSNRVVSASTSEPNATISESGLTAGVTYSINAKTRIQDLFSDGQSIIECTTNLNAPVNVRVSNATETTIAISFDSPEGNFEGFLASCVEQNQTSSDISFLYRSPGSGNLFNTACDVKTAGALYMISVSTFLNQTNLTAIKPSGVIWTATVPQPPKNVTAYPIDDKSIQMTLVYGFDVSMSQCTFYEIRYSTLTDFVAYNAKSVSHGLPDLQPDTLYNISTFALSNYSQTSMPRTSGSSFPTLAWTLASPITNITGNESLPSSLEIIISHQSFSKNVWQYVIQVKNSTHSVQRVQLSCSGSEKNTLTAVNCAWTDSVSVLNSSVTCSAEFHYNITNLRPYTNYTISVQAVNPGGCSHEESVVLQTSESAPLCLNIANTTANMTTIDVEWSAPSEPNGRITGYEVTYNSTEHDLNVTRTNETSITLVRLNAYFNYTIRVAAVNEAGVGTYYGCTRSNVTAQTLASRPFEPQLTAIPLSSQSIQINWTLSVDLRTGPETYYNLTITDTRNSTLVFPQHIPGFYNRSVEVNDLDEYWNYSVAIVAYVINANGEEMLTKGNYSVYVQTLQSTPGPVRLFVVSSLSDNQQCNASKVEWSEPAERDLNGVITHYVIEWVQVDGADQKIEVLPAESRQTIVRVKPDKQKYSFTIWANTTVGKGVATYGMLPTTGSCRPVPVSNVSNVLMKAGSGDEGSTTKSFTVTFDLNFFQSNDNGAIKYSGLFIREVLDGENVTAKTEFGNQFLYSSAMTWSEAVKLDKIPEYRATEDNWLPESSSVTREKRSSVSNYTIIIGSNSGCSKSSNEICNGPLPSNRQYRVRAILCTEAGCYKTEYTTYIYITINPGSMDWIAAVVIVPIVCIIALLLVLYFWRRQRPAKTNKSRENENRANGLNGDHQRFRITSKPIPVDSFIQIITEMHRDSDLLFSDEYKEIQDSSPKYPWTVAEGESVKAKNRFINILPFDQTRVRLEESTVGSDYINANFVLDDQNQREYIASQGPLLTTLDDFWEMIWQERSTVIVMLTNLREGGRAKCEQYWPRTLNETTPFGSVSVTMTHEQDQTSYVVRRFTAVVEDESRQIEQFHFVAWPDFGVPAEPRVLIDFIRTVRQCIGQQIEPPTIVHCSAGVGRTGTFIALDRLLRKLNNGVISIDIFGTVLKLRQFRCQMVQTEAQYIFIHDCMSLEINRLRNPESFYEGVYNDAYEFTSEPLYANENQIQEAMNNGNHLT